MPEQKIIYQEKIQTPFRRVGELSVASPAVT